MKHRKRSFPRTSPEIPRAVWSYGVTPYAKGLAQRRTENRPGRLLEHSVDCHSEFLSFVSDILAARVSTSVAAP